MKLKKKIGIRGPTANIHIVYNSIRSLSLSLFIPPSLFLLCTRNLTRFISEYRRIASCIVSL